MLGKWFRGKGTGPRKLKHATARRLAEAFLSGWQPFKERFAHGGAMTLDWTEDSQGHGHWVATVTPALDVRCVVVVADDTGEITEARLTLMRGGSVLAQWPQP